MPRDTADQPLQICIVVPYDLSEGGGVKHHALQLALALRAGGDEVTILGPASAPVTGPGIHGLPGVMNIISNGDNNRLGIFVAPWSLRRFFREHRFDVIHLHEPMVPSIAYWTAWLTPGVPKVCTFHAFAEQPAWALRAAYRLFAAIQYPFFHRAIAVSEPAASYARTAWSRPLAIIPNGIGTGLFRPAAAPPSDQLRLLFVGRLDAERKGFRYLLEAYRSLPSQGIAATLDVVGARGDAPEPPPLPGLTWHGAVSLDELVRRYQACDVFVAPSTGQESFGIVLLEAMSTARPIICSDIAGYRQVVEPDGALLVAPGDSAALEEAIATLARDPARRQRMGAFNRERAKAYDWDALVPRLRREYLEAIAECQTPAPARSLAEVAVNAAPELKRSWLKLAARVAAVGAVAAGLFLFLRGLDFASLAAALGGAALAPIALAVALNFVNVWCKANYWQAMLRPVKRVPVGLLFRYSIASAAGSVLAPARAGEALRIWLLKRRHGLPIGLSGSVFAMEKLADLAALLVLLAPLPWLWPEGPPSVVLLVRVLVAVAVAAGVALWLASRYPPLSRFFAGFELLRHPRSLARAFAFVVASWLADLTVVWLVIAALGIDAPPSAGLVILLTVNLAIAIPAAPASVGTLELGALAAFDLLGLPRGPGLAFALLYHGLQVLPILLVGLIDGRRLLAMPPHDAAEESGLRGRASPQAPL